MQKCQFSETQFAFQYTFEYHARIPMAPMPFFPNLQDEGEHYGYDMCILNEFFQFKISPLHESIDYKDETQSKYWTAFNQDFYLMDVKASKNQFKLLKELADHRYMSNEVYYVIPEFHTGNQILNNHLNNTIVQNTAHFNLGNFPTGLTGNHRLAFTADHNYGLLFSEGPYKIRKEPNDRITEDIQRHYNEKERFSMFNTAKSVLDTLLQIDRSYEELFEHIENQMIFVKSIQGVLLNKFNVHWKPVIDYKTFTKSRTDQQ